MDKRNHYGPKNRKYTVRYNHNSDTVDVMYQANGETYSRTFSPVEFIYGQIHFNGDTDKYPDYVHAELWAQHDNINYVN